MRNDESRERCANAGVDGLYERVTIQEYVTANWPSLLEAMVDIDQELTQIEEEAEEIANQVGFPKPADRKYPVCIWQVVFAGE